MATIKACDRCGALINPESSVTCVHITKNARITLGTYDFPVNMSDVLGMRAELCVSCAMHLREWMKKKEEQDDLRKRDDAPDELFYPQPRVHQPQS